MAYGLKKNEKSVLFIAAALETHCYGLFGDPKYKQIQRRLRQGYRRHKY